MQYTQNCTCVRQNCLLFLLQRLTHTHRYMNFSVYSSISLPLCDNERQNWTSFSNKVTYHLTSVSPSLVKRYVREQDCTVLEQHTWNWMLHSYNSHIWDMTINKKLEVQPWVILISCSMRCSVLPQICLRQTLTALQASIMGANCSVAKSLVISVIVKPVLWCNCLNFSIFYSKVKIYIEDIDCFEKYLFKGCIYNYGYTTIICMCETALS